MDTTTDTIDHTAGADETTFYHGDMVDGVDPKYFVQDQDGVPPLPEVAFDLQILQSLRRLMRAADIFSRQLAKAHRITGPQLMCLHKLLEADGLTVSQLSNAIFLSASTVVGILDRLEAQGLVTRVRSDKDRRKVWISVTQAGRDLVDEAPSPLQQALQQGLGKLSQTERRVIADNLDRIVCMLELQDLDAAPLLETSESLDALLGDGAGSPAGDHDERYRD